MLQPKNLSHSFPALISCAWDSDGDAPCGLIPGPGLHLAPHIARLSNFSNNFVSHLRPDLCLALPIGNAALSSYYN